MSLIDLKLPVGNVKANVRLSNDMPVVLILHPHPLHGGTMNNNIVRSMYKLFLDLGFSTCRFDFRRTTPEQMSPQISKKKLELAYSSNNRYNNDRYLDGREDFDDAAYVLDWMKLMMNGVLRPIWVVGYAYGAWIGMQLLMRRPEITNFIAISPPANCYDFDFLIPCPIPGLIIHGANDPVIPESSVSNLVKYIRSQRWSCIEYNTIDDADHCYTDKIEQVISISKDYVMRFTMDTKITATSNTSNI